MNAAKLRAWWWHRQGLDGTLRKAAPAAILERSGWARSVGGAGPYVTLFARGRTSRADVDAAVAKLQIHELPAARGCTYVLPASDFGLGLVVGRPFGESDMRTAEKLGASTREIDTLCDVVLAALGKEPLEPEQIKAAAGKSVRNFGDEGKKRGMSTSLPIALGRLQSRGEIRRVPIDGRLDQQRYKYVRWNPNLLSKVSLSPTAALTELAQRFFRWVGPATLKEFQWFAGAGVRMVKEATQPLGLVAAAADSDRLLLPDDATAFANFVVPDVPQYELVSSLDAISAARRDVMTLVDERDQTTVAGITLGERPGGVLVDLAGHAILDRGRLVGYWEYDFDNRRIVWATFSGKPDKALHAAVDEMEGYVRDQLGDARSFSLDSPKSRRPKLEALARLR